MDRSEPVPGRSVRTSPASAGRPDDGFISPSPVAEMSTDTRHFSLLLASENEEVKVQARIRETEPKSGKHTFEDASATARKKPEGTLWRPWWRAVPAAAYSALSATYGVSFAIHYDPTYLTVAVLYLLIAFTAIRPH